MTSSNVPALVSQVGGALEKVVSDIEAYTDSRFPLDRRGQMALARLVEDRPGLNTEPRIALLVDALSFHGVSQRTELTRLIDEYGVEAVYLALDYLYEVGERSRGSLRGKDDRPDTMRKVRRVTEFVARLWAYDVSVKTPNGLYDIIFQLEGLDRALDAPIEDVLEVVPFQSLS